MYSQYEALARERMLEQRSHAAHQRLAHQLRSARWWERVAAYSASRAARSQHQLEEQSSAEYSLVG